MQKVFSFNFKLLLFLILALSIACNYHFCLAEDSQDDDQSEEQVNSIETCQPVFQKKVIDFSNGAQGFTLRDNWEIRDGELQFIPTKKFQGRLYTNLFLEYTPPNLIVSVNTRWLGGAMNYGYGLAFKHNGNSCYCFLLSQKGYATLRSIYNHKWKTVRGWKKILQTKNINNSLKVICEGPLIKCFINEIKVFEVEDKYAINDFYVGICTSERVHCGFKDFTVEQLGSN